MCSVTSGVIEPAWTVLITAAELKQALIKGAANRHPEHVKQRKLDCENRILDSLATQEVSCEMRGTGKMLFVERAQRCMHTHTPLPADFSSSSSSSCFFVFFGTPELAFSGTQAEGGNREANYQTDVNVCATILKGVQLPHSCSVFPSLSHSLAAFPYSPFSLTLFLYLPLAPFLYYYSCYSSYLTYYPITLPLFLCHLAPPLLHAKCAKWKR